MTPFYDPYRGDGRFTFVRTRFGTVLFAVRLRWHFYWTRVQTKPGYFRIYFGPFEIELSKNHAST